MAVIGKAEITISDILDGKDGATGKGIKSIAEKYAVSSSNSTAPTTWYDSVQTMTSTNRYLWNYEIVTYTDNSTSTTAKRVIGVYGDKGQTGNTGATGPTGKGIKTITNYYLVTSASSGVTTSTSGWTTTPGVTTTTNKYLWNYEKITYTDNSTTSTTPHIIGTHGATGPTGPTGSAGKGIKSVANYYLASASGSGVTASTSGWTTTVQTITASKKYLWNYEKITYTDNSSSSTSPCIIGVYGDKGQTGNTGATGPTGNGIKSITEYYQISTSNTTAPTTWLTTVPTLTATNKYLWNYEKITYTNGTSVDTAKRVIGVYGDKGNTGATGPAGEDANQVVHDVSGNGNSNMYIEFATIKINRTFVNWPISFTLVSRGYESSDVQIMFKNSADTDPGLNYIRKNGTVPLWIVKTEASTWVLIIKKSEPYGNVTVKNYHNPVYLPLAWTSTQVVTLRSGAIAATGLQESKTATNYMNFDNNGLVIGDLTKGTLGRNVLIDSDSVDIRNGTNTLATFSDNLIELGKGNTNSAIKLCNGVGEINLTKNEGTSDLELIPDYSLNINSGYTYLNGMYLGLNADNTFLDKNVPFDNLANAEVYAGAGVDKSYVSSTAQSGLSVYTRGVNERSYIILNANSYSKKTSITISSQYNDERSKASTIDISPDGIKIESGNLYDKYNKIFPNGVPVYGGSNGPDPNTTLDSLILSAHANAPGSGFKYIYTAFYNDKKTTSNRSQFAVPYGDSSNYVYYRFYYNGSWSAWYQLADQNDLNSVSSRVTTAQNTANSAKSLAQRAVNWVGTKHNERLSVQWALASNGTWTMYFYIDGTLVRTW